jgi:hypothetical protein
VLRQRRPGHQGRRRHAPDEEGHGRRRQRAGLAQLIMALQAAGAAAGADPGGGKRHRRQCLPAGRCVQDAQGPAHRDRQHRRRRPRDPVRRAGLRGRGPARADHRPGHADRRRARGAGPQLPALFCRDAWTRPASWSTSAWRCTTRCGTCRCGRPTTAASRATSPTSSTPASAAGRRHQRGAVPGGLRARRAGLAAHRPVRLERQRAPGPPGGGRGADPAHAAGLRLATLARGGLEVPMPRRCHGGGWVVERGQEKAMLLHWLPGRTLFDGLRPVHLHRVGRWLARLHRAGDALEAGRAAVLPDLDGLGNGPAALAAMGGSRAAAQRRPGRRRPARVALSGWPRDPVHHGFVHGDLHPWNLAFRGGAVGAFDFDEAGQGWRGAGPVPRCCSSSSIPCTDFATMVCSARPCAARSSTAMPASAPARRRCAGRPCRVWRCAC